MQRGAVFHGIKRNILFRCAVNELHEAMSFSLAQELKSIRKIIVRIKHLVHNMSEKEMIPKEIVALVNLIESEGMVGSGHANVKNINKSVSIESKWFVMFCINCREVQSMRVENAKKRSDCFIFIHVEVSE